MNRTILGKTLVGSTIKAINYAKMHGILDLKELYFFNLVSELHQDCSLADMDYTVKKELEVILRDLRDKYPSICDYRERRFDKVTISGKQIKDLNIIGSNSTVASVNDYNCLEYSYTPSTFISSMFLDGYSGLTPKYIKINSLPSLGNLQFNEENVVVNQIILLEEINNLTYNLGLVYSDAVDVTFTFQIGDDQFNTNFSNEATFTICVPELQNIAPTIEDSEGVLDENYCKQFTEEDFVSNFNDVNEGDIPLNIRINTLPTVGNLQIGTTSISVPYTFSIENISSLNYCLDENYSIVNGSIYQYSGVLSEMLLQYANDGYNINSITNGDFNLIKTEEEVIFNSTNIYAFFDTTSMSETDGVDAKNALQAWFDTFTSNNETFNGNLYIIPLANERWVSFGSMPWTGQFGTPTTSGLWSTIAELPSNINSVNWTPDEDVMILAFMDESHPDYHSDEIQYGFSDQGQVVTEAQPTTAFVEDFAEFKYLYYNYNSFNALLYPIVQDIDGQGGSLVLQAMAALENTILTQQEIDAYNTTVDVSLLLTENPYNNHPIPNTSPPEFLEPLKNYNWKGQLDKLSPASIAFSSGQFNLDLNTFVEGSTSTVITTATISGTFISSDPLTFTFQVSDNDEILPLYSNTATYSLNYGSVANRLPLIVGDGYSEIDNTDTLIFTREMLTTSLNPSYMDYENDPAYKLIIEELPEFGELILNTTKVKKNDEILFSDIDSKKFKYIPDINKKEYDTVFKFNISDK